MTGDEGEVRGKRELVSPRHPLAQRTGEGMGLRVFEVPVNQQIRGGGAESANLIVSEQGCKP